MSLHGELFRLVLVMGLVLAKAIDHGPLTGDDGFGWEQDGLTPLWSLHGTPDQVADEGTTSGVLVRVGFLSRSGRQADRNFKQYRVKSLGALMQEVTSNFQVQDEPSSDGVFVDFDGSQDLTARVGSLSELDDGTTLLMLSRHEQQNLLGGPMPKSQPRRPYIRVEIGLGYNTDFIIAKGESPESITERLCQWNDICRLRRVTNEQVKEKVIAALAEERDGEFGVLSLWSLDMGEDGLFGAYPNLLHNGTHFRLWYWASKHHVAYAESKNGLDWLKPSLGLVNLGPTEDGGEGYHDVQGRWNSQGAIDAGFWSTEISDAKNAGYPLKTKAMFWPKPWPLAYRYGGNNLVYGLTSHGTVMYDPNDDPASGTSRRGADGSERYKSLYECHHAQTCLATSPDGLRWRPWNRAGTGVGGSPITGRAADTFSQLVWEPSSKLEPPVGEDGSGLGEASAGRYLLHTRTDFGTDGGWREIRGHRTMRWRGTAASPGGRLTESPEAWDVVAEWYFDAQGNEEKDLRQIYYLTAAPLPGYHLGLIGVIHHPRDFSEGGFNLDRRHERDVRDVYLSPSRDGAHFDLSNVYQNRPFISRGAHGAWDKDQVVAGCNMVTWNDAHWFVYLGMNERHDASPRDKQKAMGMAKIALHRFASLETEGAAGGWFLTEPIRVIPGSRLSVNAFIPVNGLITAELYREGGREHISGWGKDEMTPLKGPVDGYSVACRWNGREMGSLGEAKVQVKFQLHGRGTRMHAFRAGV